MAGGDFLRASATPSSTATPEAPSLAPGTGTLGRVEFGPSEMGRVSQWAR